MSMAEHTDLQFERAQYADSPPAAACGVCQSPLSTAYYEVNGHTVCEGCSYSLREPPHGSRAGRVLRATVAGALAALAGAILYWAILALSGYEFGLIAIVVGVAVGKAVRWGSRGRGGWAYQTLAIVLTYMAIVSAYVPMIVSEIVKQKPAVQAAAASSSSAPTPARADDRNVDAGIGPVFLAVAALLLIACIAPFAAGAQNIVGLIIIGIGVYQAWKLNKRQPLVITGPHALASPASALAAP
jgi:hypothetical protein